MNYVTEHWKIEHVYNLHTSLRRSLRFNSPTTYLGISVLETLCTDLCSKRSNVQSILERKCFLFLFTCVHEPGWTWGSQNCWQWCWTQLKLKKKILFLSRKSQQTSPLHLVWWHCWHSSRNSLSEKVRRRKPKKGKSLIQNPKVNFPPSWCSTLTSTYCCRFFFSQAQTLMLQTKTVLDRFQDKRER